MAINRKSIFVGFFLVGTVSITSFGFYFWQVVNAPNILVDDTKKPIIIEKNITFDQLQNKLYDGRYVHDLVAFSFLARIMKYDRYIKPGLYMLEPNMSNIQAIRKLRSGEQTPTVVTFTNVRLLEELAGKLTKNISVDEEELDSLIRDPEIQKKYGFNEQNFISMFLPNTYEVYYTIEAMELLDRMKMEYDRFWDNERLAQAKAIELTPKEVSILASMVQAEQKVYDEEWQRIAGLYMNRLQKGYRLDSDPTLVFAHQDFTIDRVLNRHKDIVSPYNTYKRYGLPPGPILCPSTSAIDAVLKYETHNYLYMCAKDDFSGYHAFATNLKEHNVNARKFQQALNRKRIF